MTDAQRQHRAALAARIARGVSARLRDEIDASLDVDDRDGEYDVCDAFGDAYERVTEWGWRAEARECVGILIDVGYYAPRRAGADVLFMGGRDRAPVRGGVRHDPVCGWTGWIGGYEE